MYELRVYLNVEYHHVYDHIIMFMNWGCTVYYYSSKSKLVNLVNLSSWGCISTLRWLPCTQKKCKHLCTATKASSSATYVVGQEIVVNMFMNWGCISILNVEYVLVPGKIYINIYVYFNKKRPRIITVHKDFIDRGSNSFLNLEPTQKAKANSRNVVPTLSEFPIPILRYGMNDTTC